MPLVLAFALLAFNAGCCVLFVSEYPLESWLCRSFGLGRKALTSAFHSESTTGHVDHGLLQNTYLHASPFPLQFPLSFSFTPPPTSRLPAIRGPSRSHLRSFYVTLSSSFSSRRADGPPRRRGRTGAYASPMPSVLGYVVSYVNLETSPLPRFPQRHPTGEPEDLYFYAGRTPRSRVLFRSVRA